MGSSLAVMDFSGRDVFWRGRVDVSGLLTVAGPGPGLLSSVDPVGTTIFNSTQAQKIAAELEARWFQIPRGGQVHHDREAAVAELGRAIAITSFSPHRRLVVIGDDPRASGGSRTLSAGHDPRSAHSPSDPVWAVTAARDLLEATDERAARSAWLWLRRDFADLRRLRPGSLLVCDVLVEALVSRAVTDETLPWVLELLVELACGQSSLNEARLGYRHWGDACRRSVARAAEVLTEHATGPAGRTTDAARDLLARLEMPWNEPPSRAWHSVYRWCREALAAGALREGAEKGDPEASAATLVLNSHHARWRFTKLNGREWLDIACSGSTQWFPAEVVARLLGVRVPDPAEQALTQFGMAWSGVTDFLLARIEEIDARLSRADRIATMEELRGIHRRMAEELRS